MRFVHLAALWTLAFVQPLFDVVGANAAFFVARGNTAGDILIFAFGWTLVPPLIAYALVRAAGAASERAGRLTHLAFMALFAATLALQPFTGLPAALGIAIALTVGAAAALAYARFEPARTFVSILGLAPPVVLALLLVVSPVNDLLFESRQASTRGAEVTDPKPVVILVFDELPTTTLMRADKKVDAERYPNFATLADESTWYRNATSVADGTYVAVPALLTGVRPQAELPTSREYPDNLFTLLGDGYSHRVQEPLTSVCPEALCGARDRPPQSERLRTLATDLGIVERRLLLPESLADDLPAVDQDFEDFVGDDLAEVAGEQVTADSPAGKPLRVAGDDVPAQRVRAARAVAQTLEPDPRGLWMIHNVVPHVPWRFLPDGSQYPVLGPTYPGLNDTRWGENRFLLAQAEQRHVLMTRFADRLLGDAVAQMKQSGLWDDALVFVIADHGGNISPGELRRNVAEENFAQIAGVPLFVKRPGQTAAQTSDAFVTALDVVPTIVEELGIQTDWEFDGIPLDEPRDPELLQQRNGPDAELVSATPAEFAADFDASLKERLARLPAGLEPIFAVGPRQDLVGRPVAELTRIDAGGRSAFLNNASLYGAVKRSSGVLPVYVTGSTNGVDPGTDLVVAVNGTIAASGEAYLEHGDPRFSMLVRPSDLRRADNQIEVLGVDGETAFSLVSTG